MMKHPEVNKNTLERVIHTYIHVFAVISLTIPQATSPKHPCSQAWDPVTYAHGTTMTLLMSGYTGEE
jgi:hypothetical protein